MLVHGDRLNNDLQTEPAEVENIRKVVTLFFGVRLKTITSSELQLSRLRFTNFNIEWSRY